MSFHVLRVSNLGLKLDGREAPVLDRVSFDILEGESMAFLGRTGSGKSMLLRALTAFFHGVPVKETKGKVLFEGQNLLTCSHSHLFDVRATKIAYVLQNAHELFNPHLTIRQHFDLILRHNKPKLEDRRQQAIDYLYHVGIVDPEEIIDARYFPEELDVRSRQKIMIASALCCEPKILLADEPTAEFDSVAVSILVKLLEKLKKEKGLAVVWTTSRLRRAEQFGDFIGVLDQGSLVESQEPRQLLRSREHEATREFVDGTLVTGQKRERLVSTSTDTDST